MQYSPKSVYVSRRSFISSLSSLKIQEIVRNTLRRTIMTLRSVLEPRLSQRYVGNYQKTRFGRHYEAMNTSRALYSPPQREIRRLVASDRSLVRALSPDFPRRPRRSSELENHRDVGPYRWPSFFWHHYGWFELLAEAEYRSDAPNSSR